MSQEVARVKEESDTMADAVPSCGVEELHSKDFSEPAVFLDVQNGLLKPQYVDMPLCLEVDTNSQYVENIKNELLLEPECIQYVNTGLTRPPREFNPILTDCWVRIERCAAAEKALKKHLAQLYVKENRKHTRMRDDEDFLCAKCKRNENFEFCLPCNTSMRALIQLRKLRGKQRKRTFTCRICGEKFQEINQLHQHKFLIHGNNEILQKMKNPTEFYSAYLSSLYSDKIICGSTSNWLNTTKINTEYETDTKKVHIETKKVQTKTKKVQTKTKKVQRAKIGAPVVNPGNMIPISNHKREKQSYCCKICNKPGKQLCGDCETEKALNQLSNLYVSKVRLGNNEFVDRTLLGIERPPRSRKGNRQMSRKTLQSQL
ncbi:uncharacterized protein LOC133531750 isoform X2 [Cydia pomonella]|uniref:uncharacterized protein LOC133531750 isoform X2 n=1 Tax=Cydia pomonella TaxID=82600 RepID=UPI002ADDC072|nr:uncharacterized protein LOC133531750 isoform X2 [Cydia pomonella]